MVTAGTGGSLKRRKGVIVTNLVSHISVNDINSVIASCRARLDRRKVVNLAEPLQDVPMIEVAANHNTGVLVLRLNGSNFSREGFVHRRKLTSLHARRNIDCKDGDRLPNLSNSANDANDFMPFSQMFKLSFLEITGCRVEGNGHSATPGLGPAVPAFVDESDARHALNVV